MLPCQAFIDPRNLCSSSWQSILPPSSYTTWARTALSQEFPSDDMQGAVESWWWAVCLLAPPLYHTVIECTKWCTLRSRSCEFRVSDRANLDAAKEWVWRYAWRQWSSECGDELGGCNRASLQICTWRPWLCELWGCNRARMEIHLEAVIDGVWRCTWRPWLSEIGGELGGGQSGGDSSGGRCDGSWDCIHWLTCNCGNVENWVKHGLPRDERLAGSGRQLILGWCSMWCMQYSVYAVLSVCWTRCLLYLVLTLDHGMETYRGTT